jgi:hypothetical protein
VLIALLGVIATSVSCTQSSDPQAGDYQLDFPSTAAAVATEVVQVDVYPAKSQRACQDLFEKRQSGQALPRPAYSSGPVAICDALTGSHGRIELDFGLAAFLAVGTRGGKDFLIGCEVQFVDQDSPATTVHMTLADVGTLVPATMCTRLSQFCSKQCQ